MRILRVITLIALGLVATLMIPRSPSTRQLTGAATRSTASIRTRRVPALTLRSLSRCFYAPSTPGGIWPVAPTDEPHPVRGGFDDPRQPGHAHAGIDIQARDGQSVYAVVSGTIRLASAMGRFEEHFAIDAGGTGIYYTYWHTTLLPTLRDGSAVVAGEVVGHVIAPARHVHLSESLAASFEGAWTRCAWVDPRRPTGFLRDRRDTETPQIGAVAAYVANAAAYAGVAGADARRATRLPLAHLHGRVDLRASVSDVPADRTTLYPQQPLAPAGIVSYIAPIGHPELEIGSRVVAYVGATLIPTVAAYDRVYAYGTVHDAGCLYLRRLRCRVRLIFHTAGRGFDTRDYPNGSYLYCVEAITIEGRATRRCTPVTIRNR